MRLALFSESIGDRISGESKESIKVLRTRNSQIIRAVWIPDPIMYPFVHTSMSIEYPDFSRERIYILRRIKSIFFSVRYLNIRDLVIIMNIPDIFYFIFFKIYLPYIALRIYLLSAFF